MSTFASISAEMTRAMDFAGGTVIHINLGFTVLYALLAVVIVLGVWIVKKLR